MRSVLAPVFVAALLLAWPMEAAYAQDLAPRAYIIAPTHSNAVTLTSSYQNGEIFLNGVEPVPDSHGQIYTSAFTYYHSFGLLGRSTNITASLPYAVGSFSGTAMADVDETTGHRSGLPAPEVRFSINLFGGPAMDLPKFKRWHQKTILGASLLVLPPLGQYDPTRLINLGANRWSFRPELGYSRRLGHWVIDAYGGVWFFTTNPDYFSRNEYFPGTNTQTQKPMASLQGHLSYDIKPRLWASLDGNFWFGGRTSLNGVENSNTLETNSRLGATISVPIPKTIHQSLKFSYSGHVYVQFGGDFQTVSVAWQYSWLGRPN
jgi:hypothetical protein